jgi:hypothetical protein
VISLLADHRRGAYALVAGTLSQAIITSQSLSSTPEVYAHAMTENPSNLVSKRRVNVLIARQSGT